jgi:ACS family glucarate transporter-like MFS transporter
MPYRPPQTLHPLAAGESAASRVRYRVVGMLVLMAVLLYLDRFCIGAATPAMIAELGVDKEEFGRAVGAFFLAYALMQVPAGRLSDRFGGRVTLAAYVALWSLATLLMGFAYGLTAIFFMRILLGVFQAGAYPAAAATIRNWMPLAGRARANSSVSTGGRLGGLLAFAVTPLLMQAVAVSFGWTSGLWRPVFMIYGVLGLAWAATFWWRHRDRPRLHPSCNAAEIAQIETDAPTSTDAHTAAEEPARRLSLAPMLLDYNVWVLSSINFLLNIGWVFLVTWMPTYLVEVYGAELDEIFTSTEQTGDLRTTVAGLITAVTALAGMAGNLCGGWWGDRAVARYGLRWGRRATGLVSSVLAALIYLAAQWTDNVWLFVAEMVAISFLADLVLGSLWAIYQDIGRSNTAVVLGFANMCGNLGAAGYGWLIGLLADQRQWTLVFAISSVGFCIAAVCWLVADATRVVKA